MDAPIDLDPTELPWRCAGAAGGYAWWYVDLASEEYALSVILFAGAVFSPHYAARVRRGAGDSGLAFPAVHISLSRLDPAGARQIAWVMNEHLPATLRRTDDGLRLGGSRLSRRADGSVSIEIQEDTTRFYGLAGQPLAGNILLRPAAMPLELISPLRLCSEEATGPAHFWQPLCLRAHAEVDLRLGAQPIRFGGLAYHDSNFGAGRLEDAFACWSWAHGVTRDEAVTLYRVLDRGGEGNTGRAILVHLKGAGGSAQVERFGLSPTEEPPAAGSRLLMLSGPRRFQVGPWSCDAVAGGGLLSAPFYARYHAVLRDGERPALPGMAEFLDLRRFRSPAIQFLLRYKTRRVGVPRSWLGFP
jgi:carotenoid 1,2-hydratase